MVIQRGRRATVSMTKKQRPLYTFKFSGKRKLFLTGCAISRSHIGRRPTVKNSFNGAVSFSTITPFLMTSKKNC